MTEKTPKQMTPLFQSVMRTLDADLMNLKGFQEGTIEGITEPQILAVAQRAESGLNVIYEVLQGYQHQIDSFYGITGLKRNYAR